MIMMTLVERRIAERYEVALNARIIAGGKEATVALVTNISMSGIQVKVENSAIPHLMPAIDRANKLDTIPVEIEVELPNPFDAVNIRLGIVYFNRVSLSHSVIGCRFEDFLNQSARTLSEYILHIQKGGARSSSNNLPNNGQAE